jgi:hypothetical protein
MHKQLSGWILVLILVLVFSGCTPKDPIDQPLEGSFSDLASAFVAELAAEDFDAAYGYFNKTMREAISKEQLTDLWGDLIDQVGAYKEEVTQVQTAQDGFDIIIVTAQFEVTYLDIRVVFDSDHRVAGLFFQASSYTPGS